MKPIVFQNASSPIVISRSILLLGGPLFLAALLFTSSASCFAEGEIEPPLSDALATAAAGDFSYTLRGKEDSFLLELEPEKEIEDRWQKIEVFTLSNPNRLVVDIPYPQAVPNSPKLADNKHVKSIRFGKHKLKTRIVLDTQGTIAPQYHFSKDPKSERVVISLNFPETETTSQSEPSEEIPTEIELENSSSEATPKLVSLDDLRRAVSSQIAARKPAPKATDSAQAKNESDATAIEATTKEIKNPSEVPSFEELDESEIAELDSEPEIAQRDSIPAPSVKSATLKSPTPKNEEVDQSLSELASFEKSPVVRAKSKEKSQAQSPKRVASKKKEANSSEMQEEKRELIAARIKSLEGTPVSTSEKDDFDLPSGHFRQAPVVAKRIAGGVVISLRSSDVSPQGLAPSARARLGSTQRSNDKGELQGISYERNSDGSFSSLKIRVSNLRSFAFKQVNDQEYRLQLHGTKSDNKHRAICSPQNTASIQAIVPQGNIQGTEMKIFVDAGILLEARRSQEGLIVRAIDNRSRDL